jgi:hypothetical protein
MHHYSNWDITRFVKSTAVDGRDSPCPARLKFWVSFRMLNLLQIRALKDGIDVNVDVVVMTISICKTTARILRFVFIQAWPLCYVMAVLEEKQSLPIV